MSLRPRWSILPGYSGTSFQSTLYTLLTWCILYSRPKPFGYRLVPRSEKVLALMAGMFFLTFGIYVPITYLAVQAIEAGMKPELAQYLVAILNAARYVIPH